MEKDAFLGSTAPSADFIPPPENPPPYFPSPQPLYSGVQQMPTPYPYTPQYAQHPPPPQQHTVIQVVAPPIPAYGSRPANTRCPYCNQDIITKVNRRYTAATHLLAVVLCCFSCCCLAWLPYFTDCTNDIEHECPACKKFLGVFARPNGRRYY